MSSNYYEYQEMIKKETIIKLASPCPKMKLSKKKTLTYSDIKLKEAKYKEDIGFEDLMELLAKPINWRTENENKMILNFLKESKYLEMLQKYKTPEYTHDHLLKVFSENMERTDLKKDEILFRIDDYGEKFYLILRGSVMVLKPRRVKKEMTPCEFYSYLMQMKIENEKYLVQMCIKSNYEKLCFKSYEEFRTFNEIKFKLQIKNYFEYVQKTDFEDNQEIYKIFASFNRKLSDYNIIKEVFDRLNFEELKDYLLENEKFKIRPEEETIYEKYSIIFCDNINKHFFNIFEYHNYLDLQTGTTFGDFALESEARKRTATIKARDDCILGYISNEAYFKYILQETHKIRQKDLNLLNNGNFIFQSIKNYIFENIYFNKFGVFMYNKNEFIFKQKEEADKLYILKDGEVDLYFNGSIFEVNSLLQNLLNSCLEKELLNKNETEDMKFQFYNKNILQIKSENFLSKLNKSRKLHIMTAQPKDMLGLESLYLGTEHLYSAKVKSQTCQFFVLEKPIFEKILDIYSSARKNFIELAKNKFNNYLQRLNNIKSVKEKIFIEQENHLNEQIKKENLEKKHKENLKKKAEGIDIESQVLNVPEGFNQQELKNKNKKKGKETELNLTKNYGSLFTGFKNSHTPNDLNVKKTIVFNNSKNNHDKSSTMFFTQIPKSYQDKSSSLDKKKTVDISQERSKAKNLSLSPTNKLEILKNIMNNNSKKNRDNLGNSLKDKESIQIGKRNPKYNNTIKKDSKEEENNNFSSIKDISILNSIEKLSKTNYPKTSNINTIIKDNKYQLLELQTPTSKLKSSCVNSIEKYLKSDSYLTTENNSKKINKTSKNLINLKPHFSIEERIEILNLPTINTSKNKNINHNLNHLLLNSRSEKNLSKFNNFNPIGTTNNKSFLATNITLFTNNTNFNNTIIDLKNTLNNTNIFMNTNFENIANNTLILNTENFENIIKNQNSNTIYISNADFSNKAFRNRRNINLKRGEIFKDKHSNFQSTDASRSTINNTSTQTNTAPANLSHIFFGDISNTNLSNKNSNLGNYNACAGALNFGPNIPKILNNNKDSAIRNIYGKPKKYIFDTYTQFLNSNAKNNIPSNKISKKSKNKINIESFSCEKQYYDY